MADHAALRQDRAEEYVSYGIKISERDRNLKAFGKRTVVTLIIMTLLLTLTCGCGGSGKEDPGAELLKKAEEAAKKKELPKRKEQTEEKPAVNEKMAAESELFEKMSAWTFHFASGAGGWETVLNVEPDGSFSGEYYDGDMGDDGPGYPDGTWYDCVFHGQFSEESQVSDYVYEIRITSLEMETETGTEEIKDNMRYVYTEPYGLEGVMDGSGSLYVYLPGTALDELPVPYMSWITPLFFGTYVGEEGDYVEDYPDDLPFCGLFNDKDECGFFSENNGQVNGMYLANRVKLPGLLPTLTEMHDDGTYRYEDMDPAGMDLIINTCVKLDERKDIYTDREGFVKAVLKKVYGGEDYHDLYVLDQEPSVYYDDKESISGFRSYYAFWDTGSNEDTRSCRGRFMSSVNAGGDVQFGYAYIVSSSEYSSYGGEAINFYLSSLQVTGRAENISSAGGAKQGPAEKKLVMAIASADRSVLTADEVEWVTEDDTEAIEKYGLDPNEFYDDYQIGGFTAQYQEYPVTKDCAFYVQYPEDKLHKLLDRDEFESYLTRYDEDGMLMNFLMDETGNVVFVYEPYTP